MGILDRIFQINPYKKNPLLATNILINGANLISYGYGPEMYIDEFFPHYNSYTYFNAMVIKHTAWSMDILMDHHGLK